MSRMLYSMPVAILLLVPVALTGCGPNKKMQPGTTPITTIDTTSAGQVRAIPTPDSAKK